ncbi:uncharacterized protein [Macrobrachium rosenbergii]|uniref:uncharacterized protein isoform X4 n=1 Tax=Macrobrachium rosenbergii TaxID=79674 RepID=UPI0034D519F0
MGTCMSRCWPSYPDHRYIPVRSRYLRHEETVQLELIVTREDQPRRLSTLTSRLGHLLDRLRPKEDDEIVLASNHDQEEEEEEEEDGEDQGAYEESPLPVRRTSSRLVTIGVTGKRWGIRGTPGSSLPSLTEPDSPPTTSLDLEWEPEAGLVRMSRESLGEEEGSHTAESNSWVARSSCSTPNSLEWDFRASTLSLRGGIEDDSWQHTDMETEQLLHEIEQLAARALADTGHGLQAAPR